MTGYGDRAGVSVAANPFDVVFLAVQPQARNPNHWLPAGSQHDDAFPSVRPGLPV
ncbi:hypothetical protein AB0B25_21925 [Nocardia sp. NPDC049190]|uniref:hypothetical protein n=1 Tax=Nocardia sp. NPDC049190 TaxID=3155650 RepID=UPI0033CB0906